MQYHPEYSFADIAAVVKRLKGPSVEQGLFRGDADHAAYVGGLEALERNSGDSAQAWQMGISEAVTDPAHRTRELKNWIERLVLPTRAKRGRG